MKIERKDSTALRRVLIGLIVDPVVVARIADRWTPDGIFSTPWANLVAGWCVKYFRKYGCPIGMNIETVFDHWAEKRPDAELAKGISQFLAYLSETYDEDDPINSEHLLDLAKEQMQLAKIKRLQDQIEQCLESGQVQEASDAVASYVEPNLGAGSYVEPHVDFGAWSQAFEADNHGALYTYPGELGKLVGNSMHRGAFIAWMGVEKAGKSYTLLDAAVRCVRRRLRVAYFEAGDLGQDEVIVRLGERVRGLPRHAGEYHLPGVDDEQDYTEDDVFWSPEVFSDTVGPQSGFQAYRKLCRDKGLLKISEHPNSSLSTADIDAYLSLWDAEGWTADVVVVDYADILAPNKGVKDPLEQIDDIWKHLRRISQKWNVLLLTATQASANAYDQFRPLSRKNFSGRKTKLAHVSGMLGLNVPQATGDFSPYPIAWNWIVRRKGYCNENYQVLVYGCLGIGRPILLSAKKQAKAKKRSAESDADFDM